MDKKKLIGTIIGVILFGMLIVGATYAWLSFNANVINATYTANTMNFLVDYTKGQDIVDVPIVGTGTPSNAASLVVKAAKHTGSPDGYVTIHLTTTSSNTLTTGGIVNYAICKEACSTNFSAAKLTGTITAKGTIDLYTDDVVLQTAGVNYYVYFWIDGAKLTNSHIGQAYSGYIHASADQKQT